MRILIADSDEELLQTLQSYLRKRGHDVQLASNGLDCITSLREGVPDIVVLDYGLQWGGCDGVLAALRDDSMLADVRVILVADSEMQLDVQAGTHVVDWLQKPFLLSDLLLKILAAPQILQPADDTSESRMHFISRRGRDENVDLLPRWINPLRINAEHQRVFDLPR